MRISLKFLTLAASIGFAGSAIAQDDSSSSAAAFPATVAASEGVVIRVPVDANGVEVSKAAEMRVVAAAADNSTNAVLAAFEAGVVVGKDAILDVNSDSSTSHSRSNNCGWRSYSNYGNYGNYYGNNSYGNYGGRYNSYTPSYSYNQSSWSYSYSQSYSSSYSGYDSYYGGYNSYSSSYSSYNYYSYQPSSRSYGGRNTGWGHGW